MADLTAEVAAAHKAPHQTGHSARTRKPRKKTVQVIAPSFAEALKFDPNQPRDEQGQWAKTSGRSFTSEEGYQWHEQGPVADWARALPHKDHQELSNYASFGYHDINDHLRGRYTPRLIDEFVRPSSQAEEDATSEPLTMDRSPEAMQRREEYLKQFGHPFGKSLKDYHPDDPYHRVVDAEGNYVGRVVHNIYTKDPVTGETVEYSIQRSVPDLKYVEDLKRRAANIDDLIAHRGYVLPEAITVERGAYLPGVSYDDLKHLEHSPDDHLFEEKGFTSTMVGEAQNRANSYPVLGKSESLYNRFGDKMHEHEDEVGSAVRFHITLPAGTKVASIEASRRLTHKFPKKPITSQPRPPNIKEQLWVESDYDGVPTVDDRDLTDPHRRSESEVLLGSGARFRVTKVMPGASVNMGDMKPVKITKVFMEYIGGGSSHGRES